MAVRGGGVTMSEKTRIIVRKDTRDNLLKPLKRGDESYDDVVRKLIAQYDPDPPDIPDPELSA